MNETWDVLVVDDEPVVRDSIVLVLRGDGLRVATVDRAEAALVHPALESVRLVLCDLMLPGRPGLDVLRVLKARRPEVPVVMMTGYATAEITARVMEAGAAGFLRKPFDFNELLSEVRRALSRTEAVPEENRS